MKPVEIVDARGTGWLYVRIPQRRGAGGSVFRSLGTKSMDEARAKVRESKLDDLARASLADALTREVWTRLLAGRNLKVRDTIESYESHRHVIGDSPETIRHESGVLDRFIRSANLANEPIAAVEASHVAAFVNQPGPQKLATRELWLAVINGWLSYLSEQRWIVRNPTLDVVVRIDGLTQAQLISTPRPSFTEGEVQALLAAVPRSDFWHGAILLGYEYGLRIGAVATLEEGNVVNNRMRLYTKKGRRVVDEPMADAVWTWLQEWRPLRPASDLPFIFPVQAAIHSSGSSLLSSQFARLLAKHGIANRMFHSLRSAATARRWGAELNELGPEDKRRLMSLVAEKGFRAVQSMLAHAPGSEVTDRSYMPKT